MTINSQNNINIIRKANSIEIFKYILCSYPIDINREANILVAGAGNGLEAVSIKKIFDCSVTAIDLRLSDDIVEANEGIAFSTQDLMELNYPTCSFSLVFCIHVLEHVQDHKKVLSELNRVLAANGILLVGFPNKNRLFGYINSPQRIGLLQFIKWNLDDIGKRLMKKFEKKYGAHAGFTQKEFIDDAHQLFKTVIPLRKEYLCLKYRKFKFIIRLINYLKLGEYLFPSNYFICIKE